MNSTKCTAQASEASQTSRDATWLVAFFGLAYFCQHFAQAGFISQPLSLYFKEVLGYGPKDVTIFFSVLTIPWMIKPLYGLICDYLPLFGYRRKSYLLILSLVASAGFLMLSGASDAHTIRTLLLITAASTAFADVAVDGLMVELGKKTGLTARFQSSQWLWFYVASAFTSFAGGLFAQYLTPETALHWAARVTAIFPLVVLTATWFLVKEERSQVNIEQLKATTGQLWQVIFRSPKLWVAAGFIAFWNFSPSFGTPMYYHMVDNLKFSQEFIGWTGTVGAFASLLGAWIYKRYLSGQGSSGMSTRTLLYATTVLGTFSTIAYLLMVSPVTGTPATAMALTIVFGPLGAIAMLAILNYAAENCPRLVEALVFSALMSVYNFAAQGGSMLGGWLFEDVFGSKLSPLIWVSAAFTAACLTLIPWLPESDLDRDGEGEGKEAAAK
jgi:MFS family permease